MERNPTTPMNASADRSGITGFVLKMAAIVGMTANHVSHIFMPVLPVVVGELLFWLGGITFPIMAFLLVEGYRHTSSLRRYAARLAVFAVISQIPFSLLFGSMGNVLITLLIGLLLLWAYDTIPSRAAFAAILFAALAISLWCDWAVIGPLMILAFYALRPQGHTRSILTCMLIPYAMTVISSAFYLSQAASGVDGLTLSGSAALVTSTARFDDAVPILGLPADFASTFVVQTCNLGYAIVGYTLATLLLLQYRGQRGRPLKWLFYAYYPGHLFAIWLIAKMGGLL